MLEKMTFLFKSTKSSCQLHIIRTIFSWERRARLGPKLHKWTAVSWSTYILISHKVYWAPLSSRIIMTRENKGNEKGWSGAAVAGEDQ